MQYRMRTEEKDGKLMRMEATFEFQNPLVAELVHRSMCPVGNTYDGRCFYLKEATVSTVEASNYDHQPIDEAKAKAVTEKAEAFAKEALAKERDFMPAVFIFNRMRLDINSLDSQIKNEVEARSRGFGALRDRVDYLEEVLGTSLDDNGDPCPSLLSLSQRMSKVEKAMLRRKKK